VSSRLSSTLFTCTTIGGIFANRTLLSAISEQDIPTKQTKPHADKAWGFVQGQSPSLALVLQACCELTYSG